MMATVQGCGDMWEDNVVLCVFVHYVVVEMHAFLILSINARYSTSESRRVCVSVCVRVCVRIWHPV